MLQRTLIGGVLAVAIALAARRTRSLAASGALAAALLGTLAAAAGSAWAILLVVYFVSSSLLSHWGRVEKERRTASVVEKGGERDAAQVFANGGVFGFAALLMIVMPDARWLALGMGSLAASAADTWATEIGTLFGGTPRSITTFRRMPVGQSGGVSAVGTVAAVGAAAFVTLIAQLLGVLPEIRFAVLIGGVTGAVVDSLLGATLQSRRWCPRCDRATEREIHDCGTETRIRGGLRWLNNDVVNFLSTAAGGLLAAWMVR
jgi:uncharacterized protein (TIGR00297 family)